MFDTLVPDFLDLDGKRIHVIVNIPCDSCRFCRSQISLIKAGRRSGREIISLITNTRNLSVIFPRNRLDSSIVVGFQFCHDGLTILAQFLTAISRCRIGQEGVEDFSRSTVFIGANVLPLDQSVVWTISA